MAATKAVLAYPQDGGTNTAVITRDFSRTVARVVRMAGLVILVGVLLDLGALVAQRSAVAEWEFVAATRTLEALPSVLLAIVFFYIALHVRRSPSLAAYRILACCLITLGLVGGLLGFLVVTDYFALARSVAPEAKAVFRASVAKAVGLAALDFLVLLPAGILGLRKPKG